MAVISFSNRPEETWCVAGWAFRQILDDVISQHQGDEQMASEFEQAKRISGLPVELLERSLADRITKSIRNVATAILSGSVRSGIVHQPYGDETTIQQYLESLKELLQIVSTAGSGDAF
jgi:hypothetical protein